MFFSKRGGYRKYFIGGAVYLAIFFAPHVFAGGLWQQNILDAGELILKLLSWLWVVPAILAGQLMTNDFVYGSVLHFDVYLWKIWTFMRILANFALGFIFLRHLLKHILVLDELGNFASVVKKTLIAGILIQMSRFLMAVLIDLSLVMTSAVSAVPHQIMKQQFDALNHKIAGVKTVYVSGGGISAEVEQDSSGNIKYFDDLSVIAPQADTVSAPLLFLGAGILNLFEYQYIGDSLGSDDASVRRDLKNLSLGMIMKVGILVAVTVPLIVLMITNAIRIFWIWIWIIMLPFLILDIVFHGASGGKLGNIHKGFTLGNIFGLIFQPVVVVGLLSLGLVLVIGVRNVLSGGQDYERQVLKNINAYFVDDHTTQIDAGSASLIIRGSFLKDLGSYVGGIVGQLILIFLTIFLLRSLVKVGFSTASVTASIVNNIYDFVQKSAQLIHVPIPFLGSESIANIKRAGSSLSTGVQETIRMKHDEGARRVFEKLGVDTQKRDIVVSEGNDLRRLVRNNHAHLVRQAEQFWNRAKEIAQTKDHISYTGEFKNAIDYRLDNGGLRYLRSQGLFSKNVSTVEQLNDASHEAERSLVRKYIDAVMKSDVFDPTRAPRDYANVGNENIESVNWGGQQD